MKNINKTNEQLLIEIGKLNDKIDKLEKAGIEGEQAYKEAQSFAHIGHWNYNVKKDNLFWSDELYLIFELDNAKHPSIEVFLNRIHQDDRDKIRKQVEGGKSYRSDYRIVMDNGSIKYIHEDVKITHQDDGKIVEMNGTAQDITKRKKIEKELEHSHDLMSYVMKHNNSAVAIHDRDLKYIYVSQNYLDQYKVKEKDVIGKHHYDVFPDLPQKWRDVHQKALAGEVSNADEDPYERADGSIDWTRWECRPWYEKDGSIGGIIVYTEVITNRKRIEEKLKKSESDLKAAQRIGGLGFWDFNVTNGDLNWSDESFIIYGFKPQEFKPTFKRFMKIVYPEDIKRVQQNVDDALKGDSNYDIDFRFILPNKDIGWIHSEGEVTRDKKGKPIRFFGTQLDITNRKQIEEELQRSETFNKTLLDTSPNIIYVYDIIDGKNIYSNKGIEKILGYSVKEIQLMGNSILSKIMHPNDFEKYLNVIIPKYQTAKDKELIDHNYRMKHKDGTWRILRSQESIFNRMDDGTPQQIFGITYDITDRKKSEDHLKNRNKELELFNEITVGREIQMIELKKEINKMLEKSGKKPKYKIPV